MITLSIIIVNWNTKDDLRNCLESITANTRDLSFEIIVVDNHSIDGSVEMLEREYPEVILIKNQHNKGYSRSNNQGILRARGQFSLILNPDTIILPGALEEMCRFLNENQRAAACGPRILDRNHQPTTPMLYDPTVWQIFGKDTFLRRLCPRLYRPQYFQPSKRILVDRISGCCFLARVQALKSVGLFEEKIFLFYEEADLFYRLRRKGWTVYYLPDISIIHLQGQSVSRLSKFQEEVFTRESSLIYFRNRYGFLLSILLELFLILSYISYIVVLRIATFIHRKNDFKKKEAFYFDLLKTTIRSLLGQSSSSI